MSLVFSGVSSSKTHERFLVCVCVCVFAIHAVGKNICLHKEYAISQRIQQFTYCFTLIQNNAGPFILPFLAEQHSAGPVHSTTRMLYWLALPFLNTKSQQQLLLVLFYGLSNLQRQWGGMEYGTPIRRGQELNPVLVSCNQPRYCLWRRCRFPLLYTMSFT